MGQKKIENPFVDFPPKLRSLIERNSHGIATNDPPQNDDFTYWRKNLEKNIRNFNAMFSFGSNKAKQDYSVLDARSPYVYKVHGAIYHRVNLAMHPEPNEPPSYAQLFFIDTAEATRFRMDLQDKDGNRVNEDCGTDLAMEIDELLRQVNPYYES